MKNQLVTSTEKIYGRSRKRTSRICSFPDCRREHSAHGYCQSHDRQRRLGKPLEPIQVQLKGCTPEFRFWEKVDKTGACWNWTAHLNADGYGRFNLDGRLWLAHRLAYTWKNGDVPDVVGLDHVCHNRGCVNPDHLRPVTAKQNQENRRGAQRDNKTGYRGVHKHTRNPSYVAAVRHNGERIYIGSFPTAEDANQAVIAKRLELYTHNDLDRAKAEQ